ncbi:transketolase-like TK C-terminal-containing protein [Ponticoccus litoralis]|uniref:Transketolase C-terminal domain-containing protein n=1 Tax=Ponticoccus litoralis TaxID=422297 RepID=A0AAW9SMZ1_9RHOB
MRRDGSRNLSRRGAYLLPGHEGARDVTLLATGTEVALAVEARALLAQEGIRAAVVSMPCWELFDEQDAAYQSDVLGTAPRVGVEAAMAFGWQRWLDRGDAFVGMTGFGASDRTEALYRHFGVTAERIAKEARGLLGR